MSYDGDSGWHNWLSGIPNAGKYVLDAFDLCHARGVSYLLRNVPAPGESVAPAAELQYPRGFRRLPSYMPPYSIGLLLFNRLSTLLF